MNKNDLVGQVREKYAAVAASGLSSDQPALRAVAEAFGYSPEELAALPGAANMGLSCGNPTAIAALKPGEIVVDLGCGGGIDVLLASRKVGPLGKVIGIDMTPEMIELATRNAAQFGKGSVPANVAFHLAPIDQLPLSDESVDCLISNCVLNLAPDKPAVFREMFRVLKPGGRVAVSDIALKQELPPEVKADLDAYVGCVAGALEVSAYKRQLLEAGFADVQIVDAQKDLGAYARAGGAACCSTASGEGCCGAGSGTTVSELHNKLAQVVGSFDVNAYAASVQVYAVKNGSDTAHSVCEKETPMTTLQVFDRPMCCSTGVCGPSVDPVLPRFAADLDWLRSKGVTVERYNLAQQPAVFGQHADVKAALQADNVACLPLFRVNGEIVFKGKYPSRAMLARWCDVTEEAPRTVAGSSCCGSPGCC